MYSEFTGDWVLKWFRFNGLNFLEKWRGKKIMFVGDSLSLNQFQSLTCMIYAWVPKSKTTFIKKDGLASVTFEVMFLSFAFSCLFMLNSVAILSQSIHFLFPFSKEKKVKVFVFEIWITQVLCSKMKYGRLPSSLLPLNGLNRVWKSVCSYYLFELLIIQVTFFQFCL